eukprot:TRINITY_DN4092_c0_g1_i5.p1 TRINITY_DN4092_c0_g1~~TRINITY_DN4092_c0_g1_i5.p1  ORF type:complete len:336 (+),score=66.70 TRINITY_DN4092_c0_g1_i5:142-1149(+)
MKPQTATSSFGEKKKGKAKPSTKCYFENCYHNKLCGTCNSKPGFHFRYEQGCFHAPRNWFPVESSVVSEVLRPKKQRRGKEETRANFCESHQKIYLRLKLLQEQLEERTLTQEKVDTLTELINQLIGSRECLPLFNMFTRRFTEMMRDASELDDFDLPWVYHLLLAVKLSIVNIEDEAEILSLFEATNTIIRKAEDLLTIRVVSENLNAEEALEPESVYHLKLCELGLMIINTLIKKLDSPALDLLFVEALDFCERNLKITSWRVLHQVIMFYWTLIDTRLYAEYTKKKRDEFLQFFAERFMAFDLKLQEIGIGFFWMTFAEDMKAMLELSLIHI